MLVKSFEARSHKFEPFVLDVPMLDDSPKSQEAAARRAWWTVFSHTRQEPEDFVVFEYDDNIRGRKVTSGGWDKTE